MSPTIDQRLLDRIRGEYVEMPGLRLTIEQVQRLCGVERAACQQVLNALVEIKFLCVKRDGAYTRTTEGADVWRPQPVKATLRPESLPLVSKPAAGRTRRPR